MCMCAKSLQLCPTLCNSVAVGCQAPRSMGFSRQEYWSGSPCPTQGDLPDPGIKHVSPEFVGRFFSTWETPENLYTQHNRSCPQKPHV